MLSGCEGSVTAPTPPDAGPLLSTVTRTVILPTLDSLEARSARFSAAVAAYTAAPSAAGLDAARVAWRAAREIWEETEAFAFGPVATGGFDAVIDTWPVDVAGIDGLVLSAGPFTPAGIRGLAPTLQGFHAVEYLLFSGDPASGPGGLTAGERGYLESAARALADACAGLAAAWRGTGGYGEQLERAGSGSSVYGTQGAAMSEIVAAMAGVTDEVANSKMAGPLTTGSPDFEESQFSDNTGADLVADLEGVRKLYLAAVSGLVAGQEPRLDATTRAQIDSALTLLRAIGPSFNTALSANRAAVVAAQQVVLELNATLAGRVTALVGPGPE